MTASKQPASFAAPLATLLGFGDLPAAMPGFTEVADFGDGLLLPDGHGGPAI